MRILLIEPYCGGSHEVWAQGHIAHSRHDVALLALPARFYKWYTVCYANTGTGSPGHRSGAMLRVRSCWPYYQGMLYAIRTRDW